jgi:outer membrane immunogenic protein
MKKIFLATTALVALIAVPAGAADLSRPVYKAPPPVVPVCANFGGFYIGGHAGWNYQKHDWKDLDNYGFGAFALDHAGDGTNTRSRWHAGVQGGYNWQTNCTVFGVQADWSWTDSNAGSFLRDGPEVGQQTLDVNSQLRWFGTVRAKTGVVVDNVLLYVTGGFAYARFNNDFLYNDPPPGAVFSQAFASSRTRWGYAIGAGTEWSFGGNWSLVSEFMYLGFEKDEQNYACSTVASCNGNPVGTIYRYENSDNVWVSRIGLNYRFNYAPIAAKY